MPSPRPRAIVMSLLLALSATAAAFVAACGDSRAKASSPALSDDSGIGVTRDAQTHIIDGTPQKPPPQPRDAGPSDAKPPPPPPGNKPDVADSGKLEDAGSVDAAGGGTGTGTVLDSVDQSLMPAHGLDVGACSAVDIPNGSGICKPNSASGEDFVEGCIGSEAYLLDCARYEAAGTTRSICQDDTKTVGCILLDVARVDAFERGQTASAFDYVHACPPSWEGYGNCEGDFVSMCVGGEDYALDCTIYNSDEFKYTCGKNANGLITCL